VTSDFLTLGSTLIIDCFVHVAKAEDSFELQAYVKHSTTRWQHLFEMNAWFVLRTKKFSVEDLE